MFGLVWFLLIYSSPKEFHLLLLFVSNFPFQVNLENALKGVPRYDACKLQIQNKKLHVKMMHDNLEREPVVPLPLLVIGSTYPC